MQALQVLLWYIIVGLFGWLAWPMAFRLLPGLPDRGYTLSRALGLLLVGYVFWLLYSLGLLHNTPGGVLFSMLIVGGLSLWAYLTRPDRDDALRRWLAEHPGPVITGEILFLLAFVIWVVLRAYNPSLDHTENPMELAFLNGIRSSETFPPLDPWLSGYAINYYYFGYVIMLLPAALAGTATSVAFNIALALLFALMMLGSYGLVYNLVASRGAATGGGSKMASISALVGPLFLGIVSNLEGFLELLRFTQLPFLGDAFWRWLDIEDLTEPIGMIPWPRFWWWWRASRVIRDRDLMGTPVILLSINEFPFFSFLLGDMHPHVMAIPFVLLVLALALNSLLQKERPSWPQLGLLTICFGGIAFLNISDWPIYFFILMCILVVRLVRDEKLRTRGDWLRAACGFLTPLAGVLAYLPWYLTYRSLAGGILPNLIHATRFHQLFIVFGPLLVIITWFLVGEVTRLRGRLAWGRATLLASGLLIVLVGVMLWKGVFAAQSDIGVRASLFASANLNAPLDAPSNIMWQNIGQALQTIARHRLGHGHPLTPLALITVIIVALACLIPLVGRAKATEDDRPVSAPLEPASAFALLLILTGAMLVLGPEFIFIRDAFNLRLNTVFKFYYAAWLLWATASAYAVHIVMAGRWRIAQYLAGGAVILLIGAGLVYPSTALPTKTADFALTPDRQIVTLDGLEYINQRHPSEYKGILWLQENVEPGSIILEAVGGSFTYHGRVSSTTGLPTVLGWLSHESQWRGQLFEQLAGGREAAVREIYDTTSTERAQQLLSQYGVDYVFIGSLERNPDYASADGIGKFERFLKAVYQDGDVVIYRVDEPPIKENP